MEWFLALRICENLQTFVQGRSQDFSKRGSQKLLTRSPSGDRRLYIWFIPLLSLVYQRAQSRSRLLSRIIAAWRPILTKDKSRWREYFTKKQIFKKWAPAFTAKILSWRFHHLNIVGCLLKRRPTKGRVTGPSLATVVWWVGGQVCVPQPIIQTIDCEQSLFCFRFSESNARTRERQSCETRLSRLAPLVTRVAICVSRVLPDGLQKCIYHGQEPMVMKPFLWGVTWYAVLLLH